MAKKRISLSLDDDTLVNCDAVAKSLGLSRSAYVSFLVNTMAAVKAAERESDAAASGVADTLAKMVI